MGRPVVQALLALAFIEVWALRLRVNEYENQEYENQEYENQVLPAARYLNQHAEPEQLVIGSAESGFGISFDRNPVDNVHIGFNSGLRPEFIVLESNWQGLMEVFRTKRPPVFAHRQRLYAEEYHLV